MLMFSNEFLESVSDELTKARKSVQIISAFCKKDAVKFFDEKLDKNITDKTLMVRFTLEDIISGASDLDIYELCKGHNWKLYVRFDLHAKTYVFDNLRCIIGSANLTAKGLGLNKNANLEISTITELTNEDKNKIKELISNSVLMTDSIYEKMKYGVQTVPKGLSDNLMWSNEILSLLKPNRFTLFTYDLPSCESPYKLKKDSLDFLCIDKDSKFGEIEEAFKESRGFLWLCENLRKNNNELYFGALAEKLHNVLINDPAPYRKEVKELLSNLLNWIVELGIAEIRIDRPSHSQRVRLVKEE